MGTAIADTKGAHRAWSNVMCQSTIEDVVDNTAEAVITVNANYPTAMAEVTSILRRYNANVRAGYGCRLTRIVGSQFYVEARPDQIEQIGHELARKFTSDSRAVSRVDDFRNVNKWVPNREVVIFVKKDRPGILADAFAAMARCGVNVVTVAAATGPGINPDPDAASSEAFWGRASIKAYVEDASAFWDEFVEVAREGAWDRVQMFPVNAEGRPYVWDKEDEAKV